jgi:hypothetical protein
LPTSALLTGELLAATDQGSLHLATSPTTSIPVVPAVEDLATLPAIDMAADFFLISDTSEGAAQKAKKMTGNQVKAAFNIPAASSDEKTAAAPGGASGFLYNTDGTDGVLRVADSSLVYTLGPGGAYAALAVDIIDCGTF